MVKPHADKSGKEKPIASYHTSRFSHIFSYIIGILLIVVGVFLAYPPFEIPYISYLPLDVIYYVAIVALGAVILIVTDLKRMFYSLEMRETHLTIKRGVLSRKKSRISYKHITDVDVNQSAFQRLFRYGDIEIGVPGTSVQQSIRQEFTGRGDVNIERLGNVQQHRGIFLKGFKKVGEIESIIIKHIRK